MIKIFKNLKLQYSRTNIYKKGRASKKKQKETNRNKQKQTETNRNKQRKKRKKRCPMQ